MNSNHIIINIGRQLGSGGHEIGRLLAQEFQAKYYDRELLNLAARESGLSERFLEKNDEHKSFLRSFLHMPNAFSATVDYSRQEFSQDSFFQFQSEAIRKAAMQESCVFVGRCADYVLRDMPNAVSIFITAPMEYRVRKVMDKQQCDADAARKLIEHGESRRASYYNYYTGKRWGYAESYDLCVDSCLLGLQPTSRFLADFVRQRFNL